MLSHMQKFLLLLLLLRTPPQTPGPYLSLKTQILALRLKTAIQDSRQGFEPFSQDLGLEGGDKGEGEISAYVKA